MPHLSYYDAFKGLHWETGSVRNYLAEVGVVAPHTGRPYSEALLLGVSGGAVMGYFSFAYAGYDPHVVILTRNTFDPLDTLLARLGIVQTVRQTAQPAKGLANLLDVLEDGLPAIVWADMYSLPYNALAQDAGMWAMMPLVVFGYDAAGDSVAIADRARVPLATTTAELAAARGRVKEVKQRILTLDHPDPEKLPGAVLAGIWDCIKLFSEAPRKGSRNSFGLAALQHWANLLVKPQQRMSWAKEFPRGGKLLAGLTSTFNHIALFGKDGNAERLLYADFLDEAALILQIPALRTVAERFRRSGQAWDDLGAALLPGAVAPLRETRELMLRRHQRFLAAGNAALAEIHAIDARLAALKQSISADFPLDDAGVVELCDDLYDRVLAIHAIEAEAVANLRDAVSSGVQR
jgi:hypothetical protein